MKLDGERIGVRLAAQADAADWLVELQARAARCTRLGYGSDLAELSAVDLWGSYRLLGRVAVGYRDD